MTGKSLQPGLISVAIPTYNRSRFVVRAIESVLSQTYEHIQVVVSDNASTDDTIACIERVRDSRVVLIKQPENFGYLHNLNACLENAGGELFVMLSDDDFLEPAFAERLSQPFFKGVDKHSPESIGMTWCPCWILNEDGRPLWTTEPGPSVEDTVSMIAALFSGKRGPRFCSIMIRTADAIARGGYDKRYGPLCDTGNWAGVALRYQSAVCISQPLAHYTMHPGSHTSNSTCEEWQQLGKVLGNDLLKIVESKNDHDACRLLLEANQNNISNLTLTVLMQMIGRPQGIVHALREMVRAPQYLLNPFVARRLIRDGWKVIRLNARTGAR